MMPKLPSRIKIRKLDKNEHPPWDLLIKFCPSLEIVERWLESGATYVTILRDDVVGAFVLLQPEPDVTEIALVATTENSKEMAKVLVARVIEKAKSMHTEHLRVGVSNANFQMLELYQKYGFRLISIEHDYYLKTFQQRIVENGIVCRDMIRLTLDLRP